MAGACSILYMMILTAAVMVAVGPAAEAAISCPAVYNYLMPCRDYVFYRGRIGGCCGAVKLLIRVARTTPDRRQVCGCLKSLAGSTTHAFNRVKAAGIPRQCRILHFPYAITPSIDCNRVR